jgi:hypothetical protein
MEKIYFSFSCTLRIFKSILTADLRIEHLGFLRRRRWARSMTAVSISARTWRAVILWSLSVILVGIRHSEAYESGSRGRSTAISKPDI